MLEEGAAKARKLGKGVISLITVVIILGAAFQIHRLWRASLSRAVSKYETNRLNSDSNALDRSTADAPPLRGSLSDVGGPADAPANGDGTPGSGAEPNPADAPPEQPPADSN